MRARAGFTLIELLVSVAVLSILATAAFPLAEKAVRRSREAELRTSLREIRLAIDAYKRAVDEGRIVKRADESGFPPSLASLTDGIVDARDQGSRKIYFLRRIPRDPFADNKTAPAATTWGLRSYAAPPPAPAAGSDVYDVFSLSPAVGLNGVPYRDW